MRSPKVSICIPAYSNPAGMKRAIHSLLGQTYSDFEVIITDDTPDDSVCLAVKSYENDHRIKYFKNSVRRGPSGNWNYGLNIANGDYIKILHHDDWFVDNDSLADFVKILENHPETDLAFSPSINLNVNQEIISINSPTQAVVSDISNKPEHLLLGNFIGSPSATIFRRTAMRFDPRLKYVIDVEFYFRLLKKNRNLRESDRPLINIQYELPDQLTAFCINNKNIMVYENLLFYLELSFPRYFEPRFFRFIAKILGRFEINSLRRLYDCGIDFHVPLEIFLAIYYLNVRSRARIFIKRFRKK